MMSQATRIMTHREQEAGLERWPAFQPNREVGCPDCDWCMQWGHGWQDRTSYFRQSDYNPDWKFSDDYHDDHESGKDSCPRCKKAKVVYTDIVNQREEERVGYVVEFTSINGKQCFGKITEVVIGNFGRFTSPQVKGFIVDKVRQKRNRSISGRR